MSSFEPLSTQRICARTLPFREQSEFKDKWNSEVSKSGAWWSSAIQLMHSLGYSAQRKLEEGSEDAINI